MRLYALVTVVLGLVVLAGCSSGSQLARHETAFDRQTRVVAQERGVLPAEEREGWELDIPDNPIKTYTPENLYLYLDQKSDLYNRYGFRKLTHGTYRPNLLGKPTVVVEAYDMDQPLYAYGIFSVERSRADKIVDVGATAHVGEKEAVLWKGNYFVRVKLIADVEKPEEVLTMFARKSAAGITGPTTLPELGLFPADKRIPGGDAYYVEKLLGYDCLGRGFTVDYDLGGEAKATMFLAIFPSEAETSKKKDQDAPPVPGVVTTAYVKLHRALLGDGEEPQVLPGPWDHGCHATDAKLGRGLIARRDRFIVGIFGTKNDLDAVEMTSALVRALAPAKK